MMRRLKLFAYPIVILLVLITFSCKENVSTSAAIASVDYNLHIRPILSDRCFKCHGPDANARKANLRLDSYEGAIAALKDNPSAHPIVPGDPAFSEVFLRISTSDTSQLMPPVKSNLKLNKDEIELIRKWISQGAVYKPHWAFIPPEQRGLPVPENKEWPKNEIDYFILAKLEEERLSPNDPADKERS